MTWVSLSAAAVHAHPLLAIYPSPLHRLKGILRGGGMGSLKSPTSFSTSPLSDILAFLNSQLGEPFLEILIIFLHYHLLSAKPALTPPKPALKWAQPALKRPKAALKKEKTSKR